MLVLDVNNHKYDAIDNYNDDDDGDGDGDDDDDDY